MPLPDRIRALETSDELFEAVAERSRATAQRRANRLRASGLAIAQCALAGSLSWVVARHGLGHPQPFFAPVAAIVSLGLTRGQRRRRALELVTGVVLGVAVGDAVTAGIGNGAWQIAVVVAVAMLAAVLFGGGPLLVNQAAISAVLVVTIAPSVQGYSGRRALDSLVGGVLALAVNWLVSPTDPVTLMRRAAGPVLTQLAATLEDIASAIETADAQRASAALTRARAIDTYGGGLGEALDAARDAALVTPGRWRARGAVPEFVQAAVQIDRAVRNTRVLARAVAEALDAGDEVPRDAVAGIRLLAEATRGLDCHLGNEEADGDTVREAAVRAVVEAVRVLEATHSLVGGVIVNQVRWTATDLLRGAGEAEAGDVLRDALQRERERARGAAAG